MLIVVLILGLVLLWRAEVRASKSAASYSKQAGELMHARVEYERALRAEMANSLESQLSVFRTNELSVAREQTRKEYELKFNRWKSQTVVAERADAIKKSRAVNRGLMSEQLAPHLAGFAYNPKDCHFVGMPVDYLIFDGLDAGMLKSIVLLEVKTGESGMNSRERQVRDTVLEGKVRYEIFKGEEV